MGLLLSGEALPDFGQDNAAHAVKDEDSTQEEGESKTVSFLFSFITLGVDVIYQ